MSGLEETGVISDAAAADAVAPSESSRIALERIRARNPKADPESLLPDVPPERIPRHIAIIMDGNGRWAKDRNLARIRGHQAGAESIRATIEECGRLGIEVLTLFSFSSENWKRPEDEVAALMGLSLQYMRAERHHLVENNIRFVPIGRREGLPDEVLSELDATVEATRRCTGPTLCVAMNYGGRTEIVDAVRAIAREAVEGLITPDSIDEHVIESSLYTAGLPEPDLLIRTSGEMRISNFLLWQISYSELHVTDVLWPDFRAPQLHEAIRDYARRERRFGGVTNA
jgi:undecaprenyl diphosphate synthase